MTLIILEADLIEHGNNAVIVEKNTSQSLEELLVEIQTLKNEKDSILMTLSVEDGTENLSEQISKMKEIDIQIAELNRRKEELE